MLPGFSRFDRPGSVKLPDQSIVSNFDGPCNKKDHRNAVVMLTERGDRTCYRSFQKAVQPEETPDRWRPSLYRPDRKLPEFHRSMQGPALHRRFPRSTLRSATAATALQEERQAEQDSGRPSRDGRGQRYRLSDWLHPVHDPGNREGQSSVRRSSVHRTVV